MKDVVIQIEQQGPSTTHVLVGAALVGIVSRDPGGSDKDDGACSVGYGEEWEVNVAEGMDLALVSGLYYDAVLEEYAVQRLKLTFGRLLFLLY